VKNLSATIDVYREPPDSCIESRHEISELPFLFQVAII
jgi:hypothetical protein